MDACASLTGPWLRSAPVACQTASHRTEAGFLPRACSIPGRGEKLAPPPRRNLRQPREGDGTRRRLGARHAPAVPVSEKPPQCNGLLLCGGCFPAGRPLPAPALPTNALARLCEIFHTLAAVRHERERTRPGMWFWLADGRVIALLSLRSGAREGSWSRAPAERVRQRLAPPGETTGRCRRSEIRHSPRR